MSEMRAFLADQSEATTIKTWLTLEIAHQLNAVAKLTRAMTIKPGDPPRTVSDMIKNKKTLAEAKIVLRTLERAQDHADDRDRLCVKCRRMFLSKHIGNRLCNQCVHSSS